MSFGNAFDNLSMKQRILAINTIGKIKEFRKTEPERMMFEKPVDASKAALRYIEKNLRKEYGFNIIWKEVM